MERIFVNDVANPRFGDHLDDVPVLFEHSSDLLHAGQVLCSGVLEPRDPSGVAAVVALRFRPIEARGRFEVLREPRQRVGKRRPILCGDLRRFPKLVSETEESIFDTGFRVASLAWTNRMKPLGGPCSRSALVGACQRLAVQRSNSTQDHGLLVRELRDQRQSATKRLDVAAKG